MEDVLNQHKLSYQNIWANSERNDLLPPREVKIVETGNNKDYHMKVDVNLNRLLEVTKDEGITDGKGLTVELFYGNYGNNKDKNPAGNASKFLMEQIAFGWCGKDENNDIKISINIPLIQKLSSLLSLGNKERALELMNRFTPAILAHEFGHARQPKDIKRMPFNTRLAVAASTFVLIDATRRTTLQTPFIDEPTTLTAELVVATGLSDTLAHFAPSERFASEYSNQAHQIWGGIIKVETRESRK